MGEEIKKDESNLETTKIEVQRNLSLLNIVAMLVNITGHVAIFITPGHILNMSGSVMLTFVIWIVGTFLVYTLALCFTELATVFQRSGGPYLFVSVTLGKLWGFLICWSYIVLISGPFIAFASQTAALYLVRAVYSQNDCDSDWQRICVLLLAGWICLTLLFLNCFCLKLLLKIQNLLTLCKMVPICMIIISGFYTLATGSGETFKNPTEGTTTNPGHISIAVIYVIFSNGGWQALTTLTDEVKDPARSLPRAVHLTFGINIILMLLSYVAYMSVLDKRELINTNAVALLFFERVWPPLTPVVSIFVALAAIGALNAGILGHSRMLFAASGKGDMPSLLGTLHPEHKTPMVAVCTVVLYGLLMLCSGGVTQFMQFIGLCSLTMGLNVVAALLYLRYKQPDVPRPYKVPIVFPIMQVFVNIFLIVLIIYQEPVVMTNGLLIYAAGIPIFFVCIKWKKQPKVFKNMIGTVTSTLQKTFVQVPS